MTSIENSSFAAGVAPCGPFSSIGVSNVCRYNVAELALNHARGGFAHRATASPTARVDSTRDAMMSCRFFAVYRQSTERPVRLTTNSAPSSSRVQSPSVRASHATSRTPSTRDFGERVSTTTSQPSARKCFARAPPRKPEPPARIIFFMAFFIGASIRHHLCGLKLRVFLRMQCADDGVPGRATCKRRRGSGDGRRNSDRTPRS